MQGVRNQRHVAGAFDCYSHITLLLGGKTGTAAWFDFHVASHVPTDKSDIFVVDVVQLVASHIVIAWSQSGDSATAYASSRFFWECHSSFRVISLERNIFNIDFIAGGAQRIRGDSGRLFSFFGSAVLERSDFAGRCTVEQD